MDLASYLLKPVQRMGKYALLLQQLMKAVTSVQGPSLQKISEDIEELQRAEEMVRFQLRHGNDLLAMDSLRDCDVSFTTIIKINLSVLFINSDTFILLFCYLLELLKLSTCYIVNYISLYLMRLFKLK